jgi:hypothetical protein
VNRHLSAIAPLKREGVRRLSDASIAVNCGLAGAAGDHRRGLFTAARAVLRLGPIDAIRYVHASRILERLIPRVRARLMGTL